MLNPSDKILSEILIKNDLLRQEDINTFLSKGESKEPLSTFLIRSGLLSEQQILNVLSTSLSIATIDLKNTIIDSSVVKKIPIKFAWYYKFMPIKIEGKDLTIAVSRPLDVKLLDEIRVNLGLEPRVVLALESEIRESLKKNYGLAADTIDRILSKEETKEIISAEIRSQRIEDLETKTEDPSVVKLVNQIILEACKKRATDIHIEPYRNKVRVRYRVDGSLIDANLPANVKHFILPIISRIKIIANLSIEEKRLPQDGSAVVKTKEQNLDLRISTMPTPFGESMVIRILPTQTMLFNLPRLGLDQKNLVVLRELIKKPHGIIFITGPTGSGKTTTLYACLNEINSLEKKIITIEDPIEYSMEGITQIQVNSKAKLDFARGLRSTLRHDPDIIMVGEVRDLETAEIAIRTALTGHLVFSTLHTNDAASGITRLIDMGIEPYLVASSVEAFVAQRLVRTICQGCITKILAPQIELKEEIMSTLGLDNPEEIILYQGKGCSRCNDTGFYGRAAIYEVLLMREAIREAILEKSRVDYIRQIAIELGMTTLRQYGFQKVIEGVTRPEEVMNVTTKERYSSQSSNIALNSARKETGEASGGRKADSYRVVKQDVLSAKDDYNSRVYQRVTVKVAVRYKVIGKAIETTDLKAVDSVEHHTISKDISAGGVCFISGYSIPEDTILELKIQLSKESRSIDCLAKVCRSEEDGLSGVLNVAAYYLDISSADRVKIDQFVKMKLKSQERI